MRDLLRTSDRVLVSAVEALLSGAGIACLVADRHISALEAGIGAFPVRVLVTEEDLDRSRRLMHDAGFGSHVWEKE